MSSRCTKAPIALFTYNRPYHTHQTISALQNNELALDTDLYIFSDGPRNDKESVKQVRKVRDLIHSVDGFRSVTIIEREENIGLSRSIINGVTDIVNSFGKIIVLEDDMITSPYFLRYINDGLEMYKHDDNVISIHGYIYPVESKLPDTFFLKGADCWGWATWKRGWDLFEPDGSKLLSELIRHRLIDRFNFHGAYDYSKMLKHQIVGKNDSWAVRWYASALLHNRLTLYPGRSLVHNIGTDNSGTHCGSTNAYNSTVSMQPIKLERLNTVEDNGCLLIIEEYFKSIRKTFFRRVLSKMRLGY
jgi:hypothetical protein